MTAENPSVPQKETNGKSDVAPTKAHASSTNSAEALAGSALQQRFSRKYLSEDFEPGPYDVICAWGKAAKEHPGYIRYRNVVKENLVRYDSSVTKVERTSIVTDIVDYVRSHSPKGGFVKKDTETGRWYEVGDHIAREKVGQVSYSRFPAIFCSPRNV